MVLMLVLLGELHCILYVHASDHARNHSNERPILINQIEVYCIS